MLSFRELIREVPIASHVRDFASAIVMATHPQWEQAPDVARRFVRYGASPRGAQALVLGAKVRALAEGRYNVSVGGHQGAGGAGAAPSRDPELRGRGRGNRHRHADLPGHRRRRGGRRPEPRTLSSLVAGGAHDRVATDRRPPAPYRGGRSAAAGPEYYGLRGAFWGAVAAVAVLLAKHALAGRAPWIAASLMVLGGLAGIVYGAARGIRRGGRRAGRRPGVRSGRPCRDDARVGRPPGPHAARRRADRGHRRAASRACEIKRVVKRVVSRVKVSFCSFPVLAAWS